MSRSCWMDPINNWKEHASTPKLWGSIDRHRRCPPDHFISLHHVLFIVEHSINCRRDHCVQTPSGIPVFKRIEKQSSGDFWTPTQLGRGYGAFVSISHPNDAISIDGINSYYLLTPRMRSKSLRPGLEEKEKFLRKTRLFSTREKEKMSKNIKRSEEAYRKKGSWCKEIEL